MQLRVKKGLYDENDNPITDDEGKHVQNRRSYALGGLLIAPGKAFELADDLAFRELQIHTTLETVFAYKSRKERYAEKKAKDAEFDAAALQRKMKELEAQSAQAAKLRQMIAERDAELGHVKKEVDVARAEVPSFVLRQQQDMQERLDRLERDQARSAREREEAMRRSAEEAKAQAEKHAEAEKSLRAQIEEAAALKAQEVAKREELEKELAALKAQMERKDDPDAAKQADASKLSTHRPDKK